MNRPLVSSISLAVLSAAVYADSPLSPEQALASFKLESGLRAELVAAEPLTVSPCALTWDEHGRLFVAENRGYPTGSPEGPPLGVIALLEDTNRDGRCDKRTLFADGLTFPNGLLPWRGGLLITCAPDVLWLADTNGDGRADVREVWLTGFDDKNTTQLRVSHPTLGPDGWIYLTSGWTGESTVQSPKFPDRPPVKLRTDSRFHPFTGELQAVDGRAQFGQTFDDAGHRFICYNRVHVQHVVGSSRHWKRNPDLAFSATVQNCPEAMVNDLLSSTENPGARIYPISENLTTADSHAGTFSAACGVLVYRGPALPDFYGRVFICDPTGNLVHWDDLVPSGPTFLARRSTNHTEFLASTDNWFRPVNLATGPDGALYVCDMYRKTIEHPQYLPEAVRRRTDFDSGKDRGRIWRVTSAEAAEARRLKSIGRSEARFFSSASTKDLISLLGHSNVWHRDTAFRLLLERQPTNAFPLLLEKLPPLERESDEALRQLSRLASDPSGAGPHIGRVNALNAIFALSGGHSLDTADPARTERYLSDMSRALGADTPAMHQFLGRLVRATLDESPAVRATAFRLFDALPGGGPELGGVIHKVWADDPSPAVRYRVALFLGKIRYGDSLAVLARLARRDGAERWTRAAVLSGLKGRETHFFDTLMRQTNGTLAPQFLQDLCRLGVSRLTATLALTDPGAGELLYGVRQIRTAEDAGWQLAGLAGLCSAMNPRGTNAPPKLASLVDVPFGDPVQWSADGQYLRALLDRAVALLNDPTQPTVVRCACVTVLAHERGPDAMPALIGVLTGGQPAELQATAIRSLASLPDESAIQALLAENVWRKLLPGARTATLNALLAQPRHVAVLLQVLEQGAFPPSTLTAAQRNQLLKHKDEAIRGRAEKIFQAADGDRMKVFEEFKAGLALKGNAGRGREMFGKLCASCHRLDREGAAVGPDLLGARNQAKETILLHVLVPNHEIMPGFGAYQIETRDGRDLTGLVAAETESSVTLRQAQGIEEAIPRANIRTLTASRVSMMPDGLDQGMTPQDLADLLAYLKGEK